ncbi:sterol carrier family protein [Arcanobacterium sp. S3PF19]|uniref:sterol carrier family protein n=1 Tax=Arcanobacterium sp. S3PF19 TaxID=1219585 RepID=UPI000B30AA1B
MKRKTDTESGHAALMEFAQGETLSPARLRLAVRYTLEEFAVRHPGRAVEIRIPPCGAAQALPGVNHRRGTPPNVVEMPAVTWLNLVLGRETDRNTISKSGIRADIEGYLPLFGDIRNYSAQRPSSSPSQSSS